IPVIEPATSDVNFTPSSTAWLSASSAPTLAVLFHSEHGHVAAPPPFTVTPGPGVSTLRLSSIARLWIVAAPVDGAFHVNDQFPRPVAAFPVVPPSTEPSTAPTVPPPASVAVPVTVTVPDTLSPDAGEVIVEVGAVVSVEAVTAVRPLWSVPAWAPMSARRLAVACCIRPSGVDPPRSWVPSRPQAH